MRLCQSDCVNFAIASCAHSPILSYVCSCRALATQLQTLSGDFRKTQKDYLGKVKNQKSGPVEFDFLSESNTKATRRSLDMVRLLLIKVSAALM